MKREHTESKRHQPRAKRGSKGVIARGTDAAERIHRTVAGLPLDLLSQIDRLKRPVGRVRKLQDQSITATYAMVRGVNKEVELLLRADDAPKKRKPARRAAPARPAPPPLTEVRTEAPAAAVS